LDHRVTLLGPWEVWTDDRVVHLPAGRLRTLMTSLVLSAGEPVGLDVLAEQVWPERLPRRARATLHTYVGRLRKLLGPDLIHTHPGGGYVLAIDPECVDLHRFRGLLGQAEQTDDPAEELLILREALGLWRGRPFADMYSTWLDRDVLPGLTEEWFAATGRRIDLELASRPERLIAELRELTSRFPTREALWVQLITALHQTGRRAEALTTYQQVRAMLSTELGMDPSEQLVTLQRAILLDGTENDTSARSPRQLPHDVAGFTGRHDELASLDLLLTELDRPAPTIVTIIGAPGVGKTTLAVHWAHRATHHYPDAQLYLDLRGYGPDEPVEPATAAATILRTLGCAVPADADERFTALRTALAGRRALLLLDNARDADQVRPLLPGTGGLVIVTSRDQLRGLSVRDGAHRVLLPRLRRAQSVELLGGALGPARVGAEPVAALRLAELCDDVPLALAIVAERTHRAGTLAEVVTVLERTGLDGLSTGEPGADLRVTLSWSCRALREDAAAMLRRLGLHPAGEIDVRAAAAVAGVPVPAARLALDQLVAAHLVEQYRPRRYRVPALVRQYAAEVVRTEPAEERDRGVQRMLDWYLTAAEHATTRAAWAWFDDEYDNLHAVVGWAAANGWGGHARRLVTAISGYADQWGRQLMPAVARCGGRATAGGQSNSVEGAAPSAGAMPRTTASVGEPM